MFILATASQDLLAVWMQLQQFVGGGAIHADLCSKHFEVFAFQPVYLRCDPEPFSLIEPFDQHGLPESPNAFLQFDDPLLAGATLSEQLIHLRNLSG